MCTESHCIGINQCSSTHSSIANVLEYKLVEVASYSYIFELILLGLWNIRVDRVVIYASDEYELDRESVVVT